MALVERSHGFDHHLQPLLLVHLGQVQRLEELPPFHIDERMFLFFTLYHVLPFLRQIFLCERLDSILLDDLLQLLPLLSAVWKGCKELRLLRRTAALYLASSFLQSLPSIDWLLFNFFLSLPR